MALVFAALIAFVPPSVRAATRIKQNNTTALNLAGSWDVLPGSADIAQWDATVTAANSPLLGASLSWTGVKLVAPGGLVTVGAGNTLTLGASGIDLSTATQNLTINCGLTLQGQQSWKAAAGRTLNVAGTFTHSGALVDFTSFNATAILGTLANDATGILGPWAYTGSTTTLNYVKATGGLISAYSTATADAGNLTSVASATGNYKYSAAATLAGNQTGHTLQYSGAATTTALGTKSLTLDGLMNSGSGALTITGTALNPGLVTGASGELDIISNNQGVVISAVISGPGAVVYGGPGAGTFQVQGINTYTGGTRINAGTVHVRGDLNATLGGAGTVNVTVQSGAILRGERANFTGSLIMNGGTWSEGNGFGGSWSGGPHTLSADSIIDGNFNQSITGVVSGTGGLTHTGTGAVILNSANLYTGPTIISSGAVTLGASGSIANTSSISIAAGATFDISAKTSPYAWSSSTTLRSSGTATAANLKGKSGGIVNLGSQGIILTFDGLNPSLTVSQGTLSLNANPFTVNTASPLASGTYNIVTQTTGSITSAGTYPGVTGTAIGTGKIGSISVSGSNVVLTVGTPTLTVSAFTSPRMAGVTGSVTVTLRNSSGNPATAYTGTVHFTSSDGAAILPADYTFTGADAGTHTFSGVALKTVGTHSITATDTVTGAITGTQSGIIVNPAAAASLVVSGVPSPQTTGVPTSVTVTAKDAFGNTATAYTGTIHFTSSDGAAALPANYTFVSGDAGTHTFTNGVTLNTLGGPWSVTATDTVTGSVTGVLPGITVTATTVATRFAVSGFPASPAAGVAGSVMVTAQSSDGNTITGYTGTVHFTSNDGAAVLPADYTFTGGDNGTHTFSNGVALKTAGARSISATDTVTAITGTQSGITVGSAAAAAFVVSGFPSPQFASIAGSVVVTARDAYGNTATGYTGTIHFTSNDGAAVLPADYTFVGGDGGVRAFANGVTLNTAGSRSITATDIATGSITGTQSGITVNMIPSVFTWNAASAGLWDAASNWTNNAGIVAAPDNAGKSNYTLNFNVAGTFTSTHNLANGFLLNRLNFGGSTVTLAGLNLALTNDSATLPQINESGAAAVVGNNIALNADTTVSVTGSGLTLNGVISGTAGLTKTGAGTLTMGNAANSYVGETIISGGTFSSSLAGRAGFGTGAITLASGASITFNGPGPNVTNVGTFNGGTITATNGFGASWSGTVTLNANIAVVAANTMSFTNAVSGVGGFIKSGGGILNLSGASTFTGAVAVQAGTVQIASFNSVSGGTPASNLGAPTTATDGTISLGATGTVGALLYTGPGETTDRILKLTGPTGGVTITQGGPASGISTSRGESGLLKFTSNLSIPGTAGTDNRKTLTLTQVTGPSNGTNPGRGEISGSIGNSVLGTAGQLATSVTKAGPGIWTLSGANTYTGATKVQAGLLAFSRSDALGSGSLDITTGAKVQLDYIGTRQIFSLTFNAGAAQANGTYGSTSSIATFKDDTRFAGLGTVTVGAIASPTTTALARTSGSSPSSGGAAVTFTATVTGAAPTGTVLFYDALTLIGTSALNGSFQASLTTNSLTAGTHSITALYVGGAGNPPSSSAALTQIVAETRAVTTTTLTRTGGANPSNSGAAVTFTATVTGGVAPTGNVTFYNGSTALGTVALNGSAQAVLTTGGLAPGWRGLTARYAGDANNTSSTSAPALFQTVNPVAGNGKVKVFILAGQSNMVGHSWVETGRDPNNIANTTMVGGLGSLRHMLNANLNKYGYLADPAHPTAAGNPGFITRSDVWVAYWGESNGLNRSGILDADYGDNGGVGAIGPEYGFGLVTGSQLGDQVLLVKYAFGGKSLKVDFRPPSSGGTVGPYYTGMVARTHQVLDNLATFFPGYAGQGYEVTGFGWHQGWNDAGGGVTEYETNLVNLIKDLRTEFNVPNMPVSIGVTGMSNSYASDVITAQFNVGNPALHPEFAGNVTTVDTRPFDFGELLSASSDATHWNHNAESYFNVGESMGLAMMAMLPAPSSAKDILTFTFPGLPAATIAGTNISVTVPYGTNVTALAPTFTVSDLATASPVSGTARNFSTAQTYTVTAQDLSTQTYTVTVTIAPSPFTAWASDPAQGLTAGVNDGPLDDPDHDALSNLLEFTLGGAPMVSSRAIQPTLTLVGGNCVFAYERSDIAQSSTTQVVEYGDDLVGWTAVPIPLTSAGPVTITPGSPSDHVTVTIPNPGPKTFFRLKVTQ
ncbi:MAG: Ig-like domain repeat protein [Chthoniobacter sp.]|nr:Ig-like domain repeat protein [Chthoniobacter sp.]